MVVLSLHHLGHPDSDQDMVPIGGKRPIFDECAKSGLGEEKTRFSILA